VLKLTECKPGKSYFQLRYLDNGRVLGIVRGTNEATMIIASFGSKKKVKKRLDDSLIGLPYASSKKKFSTHFIPEY